jgi:hypothetical protein
MVDLQQRGLSLAHAHALHKVSSSEAKGYSGGDWRDLSEDSGGFCEAMDKYGTYSSSTTICTDGHVIGQYTCGEFEEGVAPLTCTVPHWELVANRTFLEVSKQDITVFFFQPTGGRKLV